MFRVSVAIRPSEEECDTGSGSEGQGAYHVGNPEKGPDHRSQWLGTVIRRWRHTYMYMRNEEATLDAIYCGIEGEMLKDSGWSYAEERV